MKKQKKAVKMKWDKKVIIERIRVLEKLDENLTYTHVKETDSALVGAAVKYFGNWGAALEAAGLDYAEIRALSKERRNEKVRKWSINKVIEEIREVAKVEEDLSNAYMKEKHSSLVAAASNYIGSWKKAVEMCGFDYAEIQKRGRRMRQEREKSWYRSLLLDRLDKLGTFNERDVRNAHPDFYKLILLYFSSWNKAVKSLKDRNVRKD
ncbi:MAG: hypothetical protein WCX65_08795 [bacterium]